MKYNEILVTIQVHLEAGPSARLNWPKCASFWLGIRTGAAVA